MNSEYIQYDMCFIIQSTGQDIKINDTIAKGIITHKRYNTELLTLNKIKVGDTITIGKAYYLVTEYSHVLNNYYRSKIVKCNYELKWLNSFSGIETQWCIVSDFINNLGLKNNDIMLIPNDNIYITISTNQYTKKLDRNKRIIVGNQVYTINSIVDITTPGMTKLILKECEKNDNDNFKLGIADYYNCNKYTIEIKDNDISIKPESYEQLNVIIKNNGTIVDIKPKDIIWTSSNEKFVTVDENGLIHGIFNGNAIITAKLKHNPDVKDSVIVNVTNIPIKNIELILEGADSIKWTQTKTYTAKKLVNGKLEEIPYNFEIDYNGNDEKIAKMNVTGIDTCDIIANGDQLMGYIKLKAINKLNHDECINKKIEITSFW